MDAREWMGWCVVVGLLSACGGGEPVDDMASDTSAGVEDIVVVEPPLICEGVTQWTYDPLGLDGIRAFPDDVHTVADASMATGRRVVIDPVHDAWLATQEDAVSAVYKSLEGLEGWGVTSPIVLEASGPVGEVPTWGASLDAHEIWLMQLDDNGGVIRHPYEVHFVEQRATAVIWPMGALEPSTEYALVVTSAVLDADGACIAASPTLRSMLDGTNVEPGLAHASERLSAFLSAAGLFPEEVSAAVTFTTQRTTDLSESVAAHIATQSFAWSDAATCEVNEDEGLKACERHYTSWDYRDASGFMSPEPVSPWELVVSVWMPSEGQGPWPTVLMGHGINSSRGMGHGVARNISDMGVVVVAVDAIGHGDHPTNDGNESYTGMMSFLGIDAVNLRIDGRILRDNLRQSTADRLQLLELLVQDGDLDGDGVVDVDPSQMGYVGISLGGIMGSEILALSERLNVGVLITAAARMTSIFTYASNMAIMMDVIHNLAGSESASWRLIAALQGAIDPGDPMAYARHVVDNRLNDSPPPHVLVTMAVGDPIVPNEGTRALAQGLGVEVMHPVVEDMGFTRLTASGSLVRGNLPLSSGATTGALFQFDRVWEGNLVVAADHDNLPNSAEAVHQLRHFISTWLAPSDSPNGAPEVIDPYPFVGTPEL